MTVIGITGGIGTGKSTVSEYLASKGYKIIDADEISRNITKAGSPVINELTGLFSNSILMSDGNLDRKKIADIVFNDCDKKKQLESIVTKRVIEAISSEIKDLRNSDTYDIIFLDAPLLFETGADKLVDVTWLITCDIDIRIKRVMSRDGSSEREIIARIKNQMPEEKKISKATVVIDNSKGKEDLICEIESLMKKYA